MIGHWVRKLRTPWIRPRVALDLGGRRVWCSRGPHGGQHVGHRRDFARVASCGHSERAADDQRLPDLEAACAVLLECEDVVERAAHDVLEGLGGTVAYMDANDLRRRAWMRVLVIEVIVFGDDDVALLPRE